MFEATSLDDVLIYRPKIFKDSRGSFIESYNETKFKEAGISSHFCQDNRSTSIKGVLRGLHFQKAPYEQAKLVTVTRGLVYDVCVDLRPTSRTFGKYFGVHLSEEEPTFLFIPRGFAHGFLTLSESADFFYKVDNIYKKDSESGIRFDDPSLNISWPEIDSKILLSDKDQTLPTFNELFRTLSE